MQQSNHFLHFTKKERTGIIILLSLILLVNIFSRTISNFYSPHDNPPDSILQRYAQLLKSVDTSTTYERKYTSYNNTEIATKPSTLFTFNPNTLSPAGWKQLGVREKTIATIQKYISKGGRFKAPEDLDKIWGLQNEAERLKPFVRIERTRDTFPVKTQQAYPIKQYTTQYTKQSIDINTADSLEWLSLPMIGPSFTKRILKFRERLGGFYSIDQVAETFGLPDSVFRIIRPQLVMNHPISHTINLNTATIDELKNHPYIRYTFSNAIIQYREQHGKFSSIDDLKKIMIIPDSVIIKLKPYVRI